MIKRKGTIAVCLYIVYLMYQTIFQHMLISYVVYSMYHFSLPHICGFFQYMYQTIYGVATVSTIDKMRARGGEAHHAEAAAHHQGRSK